MANSHVQKTASSKNAPNSASDLRIGVDLGGSKISAIGLDREGCELARHRIPTPRNDYHATLAAITELVAMIEQQCGRRGTVGIGMPGSISPTTRRVQNANSTWLNGKPFDRDLRTALGRDIRLANDANCFALSESIDGAGQDARSVFGVILGTGCGGGLVIDKTLINGPKGIAGEWGHNPLPWPRLSPPNAELPGPKCWCGKHGCIESWVSGPALERDFAQAAKRQTTGPAILKLAENGDPEAQACLDRHASRLARGLAMVVNIFDPEVIVLGGGLSQMPHLYQVLPDQMAPYIFADSKTIDIRPPRYGDDSGVRGAAWLWDLDKV